MNLDAHTRTFVIGSSRTAVKPYHMTADPATGGIRGYPSFMFPPPFELTNTNNALLSTIQTGIALHHYKMGA